MPFKVGEFGKYDSLYRTILFMTVKFNPSIPSNIYPEIVTECDLGSGLLAARCSYLMSSPGVIISRFCYRLMTFLTASEEPNSTNCTCM